MSKTFPVKFEGVWPYHSDYSYDEECYPNLYTLTAMHMATGATYVFEISEWADDSERLVQWVYWLHMEKCRQVGFNNVGYDYPLLHYVFMSIPGWVGMPMLEKAKAIYKYSSSLFKQPGESDDDYRQRKYRITVPRDQEIVTQIDLMRIHHFDSPSKATGLKVLEINMRSDNVQELPVPPGTWVSHEQRLIILNYNYKDVVETTKFAIFSLKDIKLRENLSKMFDYDFLNHNEAKIGEDILRIEMRKAGLNVFGRTPRPHINVSEIIFDYIKFNRPEFNEVLAFLKSQVITDTKKAKYPCPIVDGFPWQFSKGGMHGSISATIVREDDEYEIIDADVTSFYPKMAIVNGMYPAHLGPAFGPAYDGVFVMRTGYDKGTPENKAFKIALNAAYGKSNSAYSFLFDPKYTMTTTFNGQLVLCMLGEWLMNIPGLSVIQANTDGITFKSPRRYRDQVMWICQQWQQYTCLELEFAYYQAMYIRDVNNYIAHYIPDEDNPDGKRKLKGAYNHLAIPWEKDHSAVIIARAVEEYFINGVPVQDTIMNCADPYDFMIKAKIPKNSSLYLENDDGRTQLQNVTRYHICIDGHGGRLVKVMPPTPAMVENWNTGTHYIRERDGDYKVVKPGGRRPAKTYTEIPRRQIPPNPYDRELSIQKGWQVIDCANVADFDWKRLNYQYYITEAKKLIDPLL